MSETTEASKLTPQSSDTTVNRRTAIRTIAGTVAGLGAAALGMPRVADAQSSLFPETSPPPERPPITPVVDPRPGLVESTSILPVNEAVQPVPETTGDLNIPQEVRTLVAKRAKLAKNFLYKIPGEQQQDIVPNYTQGTETTVVAGFGAKNLEDNEDTIQNPVLNISYSSDNPRSLKALSLEVGEQVGVLMLESNKKKELERSFSNAVENALGISFDQIAIGRATAEQMAKLEHLNDFFDFASYDQSFSRENIFVHRERKQLSEKLLAKAFAIWTSAPEQLADKLEQSKDSNKKAVADIFLEALALTLDCAPPDASFESLGIKKNEVNNVFKFSSRKVKYEEPIGRRAA